MHAPALTDRPRPATARPSLRAGRRRIVLLLGAVLALESADLSTIGAVGPELEASLGITHAQLGLLAAAGTPTAAVATLPVGVLADRVARTPLLGGSVGLWAVAMLVSGTAGSFTMLLLSRVALGAVTATAGPTLLSLGVLGPRAAGRGARRRAPPAPARACRRRSPPG